MINFGVLTDVEKNVMVDYYLNKIPLNLIRHKYHVSNYQLQQIRKDVLAKMRASKQDKSFLDLIDNKLSKAEMEELYACNTAYSFEYIADAPQIKPQKQRADVHFLDAYTGIADTYEYITRSEAPKNETYREDIQDRIGLTTRTYVRNAVTNYLKKVYDKFKPETFAALVGCSIEDYIPYLESTMTEGMSWKTFLKAKIEIDHIIPVSAFNLRDQEQKLKCFHWSNTQLLWKADNQKKGDKISLNTKKIHI